MVNSARHTDIRSDSSSNLIEKVPVLKNRLAPIGYATLVLVFAVLPLLSGSLYLLHILILCFVYIIATSSMRTIAMSGQFPMAHAAFMGIGAYVAGMLSKWVGLPPWLTIPAGALASMTIGILTGYPFARLRSLYYTMGSLFFGIGVIYFITAFSYYTGSYAGLLGIKPIFFMVEKIVYYYFFLALTVVCLLILYRFESSRIGTDLKAIAQSHLVASSVGINEGFYRILAVAVGCFFAGLAGACYAQYNLVISPSSFNFMATMWLLMYALVGGMGTFAGPIVGTLILFMIPEIFRDLKQYSPYLSSVVLLVVVYFAPKGLASVPGIIRAKYAARKEARTGAEHAA